MREIKFRAINANGEMIYGLPYTDGVNDTIYYKEFNNRLCWRDEKGAHCNQPYKNGTLMQYTGLKDKNGKEIYDEDILKDDDSPRLEKVGWDFSGWWIFDVKTGFNKRELFADITHKEVVGNIYENLELLKL